MLLIESLTDIEGDVVRDSEGATENDCERLPELDDSVDALSEREQDLESVKLVVSSLVCEADSVNEPEIDLDTDGSLVTLHDREAVECRLALAVPDVDCDRVIEWLCEGVWVGTILAVLLSTAEAECDSEAI